MYIIIGLGNPEDKYMATRHNIGFDAITRLADDNQISLNIKKHKAIYGAGYIKGQKVLLVQPQTFMNLSGESVRALVDFYKVEAEDIIVIYDDINLELGQLRIRKRGSAGGHNGIKSIIKHLGTDEFPRVRIGIGNKPEGWDLANYVLSRFTQEENRILKDALKRTSQAIDVIIADGITEAMNRFNRKQIVDKES